MIPMLQGLLMLDPVMWSSHDNCATMCHEGCLISHPPHRKTWVLGVPTLVSYYSGLICIIDAPCRLQDHWIWVPSQSWIGGWCQEWVLNSTKWQKGRSRTESD